MNLSSLLERGEDLPHGEHDQSRKHPGWTAEEEGHNWVVPDCGDGKGDDDTAETSRSG